MKTNRLYLNQQGVTVLELLVSLSIFLLVILPISSYYLNGIDRYNKTMKQSNLRNELDFVIADILTKVEESSYFELSHSTSEDQRLKNLIEIFQNEQLGKLITDDEKAGIKTKLTTYKVEVKYDDKDGTLSKKESRTVITKKTWQISDFNFNKDQYIIDGLFKLSPDNKKLSVYLIAVPKSAALLQIDNQYAGFTGLDDIIGALNDPPPYEYIKTTKTEISVNNWQQG